MGPNLILLADDNENDVLLVQLLFKKCQVENQLHVVSDGEDVIAYLKGEGIYADRGRYPIPTLLLLDLFMQRKGGMEVLEWLQTQPKPVFPVIVLTGMEDLARMKLAYQLGAHSFLTKPLEKQEFLNLVEEIKAIKIKGESPARPMESQHAV
jgi:CheY-like chemotaxis protein